MFQKKYRHIRENYFSFQGSISFPEFRRRYMYIFGIYMLGVFIVMAILLPIHFIYGFDS